MSEFARNSNHEVRSCSYFGPHPLPIFDTNPEPGRGTAPPNSLPGIRKATLTRCNRCRKLVMDMGWSIAPHLFMNTPVVLPAPVAATLVDINI